jgi:hypothetical protein
LNKFITIKKNKMKELKDFLKSILILLLYGLMNAYTGLLLYMILLKDRFNLPEINALDVLSFTLILFFIKYKKKEAEKRDSVFYIKLFNEQAKLCLFVILFALSIYFVR